MNKENSQKEIIINMYDRSFPRVKITSFTLPEYDKKLIDTLSSKLNNKYVNGELNVPLIEIEEKILSNV